MPRKKIETEKQTSQRVPKLVFVGFGKIPGFDSFEWEDPVWLNVADYEGVFINCLPLYSIIDDWDAKNRAKKGNSYSETQQLAQKCLKMQSEITDILNTDRRIFAFCVPETHYSVYSELKPTVNVNTFSWCPIEVDLGYNNGSNISTIDERFHSFSLEIDKWLFYFKKDLFQEKMERRDEMGMYFLKFNIYSELFVNLSKQPIGVSVQRGVYNQYEKRIEQASHPIYLLHFPNKSSESTLNALYSLVKEFYHIDIPRSKVPVWIESTPYPHSTKLSAQLLRLEREIKEKEIEREETLQQIGAMQRWARLIYDTGEPLEDIVMEALSLLGCQDVQKGPKDKWDVTAKIKDEVVLFEIKGLENRSAGRSHVAMLGNHLDNEFHQAHPDVEVSQGVLLVLSTGQKCGHIVQHNLP